MASGSGASSSDVIELMSSDEETEPAPKRIKPGENAMVHIPHGVTINPPKSKPPMPIIQEVVGRGITLTKIDKLVEKPHVNRNKPNGRPFTVIRKPLLIPTVAKPFRTIAVQGVNPISLMKKINNSQIMINKVSKNVLAHPIKIAQRPSQKSVNNLPPSITVTRTSGALKRPTSSNVSNVQKKKLKSNPMATVGQSEILTVELDDDEVPEPSIANPQWYLRPEQQSESTNPEVKNNAEPEPSKLIEITIEDSPVKPALTKRTCEVGTELAITIEDSPVKSVTDKTAGSVNSDNESTRENYVPSSKKKLEYPKANPLLSEAQSIEIEIEPAEFISSCKENNKEEVNIKTNNKEEEIVKTISETIVEIEESPLKTADVQQTCTPKKDENIVTQPKAIDTEKAAQGGEFHPIYQNFIDLCFKLENSDDMKKIVEKKIKAYYRQVPKEYTESENFVDMVSSKIISMRAGPEKMYLYIKDIVDELNLQRKMAKAQVTNKETEKAVPEPFLYGEDSEFDSKRQRQIRKLEKTLKKLHRAIQKLEEQEVDFDDEEDSVYLLTESEDGSSSLDNDRNRTPEEKRKMLLQRYKERMVRVHAKFCQLTNTKMPSEPRVQIDARPGQPKGPAKRLEKWINRKVPIGTPLPFPDFHDVLRFVREANEEDKLGWNEADIMEEARDLFTRCGKKLQRRRQENEWRLAASRLPQDIDPAEANDGLKRKLEENKHLANKKETEVFNKYADRQSQLNLEAIEIGDKEAEESPVESEDDEPNEESSTLESKEKRKERLRRLIQEKSKKAVDGKAIQTMDLKNQSDSEMIIDGDNKTEINENDSEKKEESQMKNTEIDSADVVSNENEVIPKAIEKVHSISDDSNQVDSDVDELHLLQKLHSENEVNTSTLDSSDTDTPIDISDTLHSSSDNKAKATSGVISIENSSYSESEVNKDTNNSKDEDMDCAGSSKHTIEPVKKTVHTDVEIEFVDNVQMKTAQTNNDEYTDSVGNILLASSEDEDNEPKDEDPGNSKMCINLKDDTISIGDTEVQEVDSKKDGLNSKNNAVAHVNTQNETSGSIDVSIDAEDNEEIHGCDLKAVVVDVEKDKLSTKKNDVADVQNKASGSIDVCINSKDKAVSISGTEIQECDLRSNKINNESNDGANTQNKSIATGDTNVNMIENVLIVDSKIEKVQLEHEEIVLDTISVVNTVTDSDTNLALEPTKNDIAVLPLKIKDVLNIELEEPNNSEVKDIDNTIKTVELLSEDESDDCKQAQKTCSPRIKETAKSTTDLVEIDANVIRNLDKAKSTKEKDSTDIITLSGVTSKSTTVEECNLTVNEVDLASDEKTNLNKTFQSDVINNSVESVADMAENNENLLSTSDNFLADNNSNSDEQNDSLEKVLEDLQSNLRSSQPSPIIESVKNTV